MGQSRDTGNAGSQSSKTNLELLDEIDEMLNSPDVDLDLDAVRENLHVLQERAPVEQVRSQQESWDELMASVSTERPAKEETAETKKHSKIKVWRILEVAVILVLVLAVSASAFNFNPFRPLLQAVSDLVQSISAPSGLLELPETIDAEYHSLREALDANGAADAQCLTWIPKSYSFEFATVQTPGRVKRVTGCYLSSNMELLFNITKYTTDDYVESMERNDDILYQNITIDGREYQWTQNQDVIYSWWSDGNYFYELYGTITIQEMEIMIKSLR